jgi:betaine reductase
LARLTNLSDGASFLVEASSGKPAGDLTRDEVKNVLLDALSDLAESLRKAN